MPSWSEVREFFQQNGAALKAAWLPIAVLLVVVVIGTWWAVSHFYNGRLDDFQARIDLRDDQIESLEKKLIIGEPSAYGSAAAPVGDDAAIVKWNTTPLEPVIGRHFVNETVVIDGKRFDRCTFTNVTLHYRGTAPADFGTNTFTGGAVFVAFELPAMQSAIRLYDGLSRLNNSRFGIAYRDSDGSIKFQQLPKIEQPASQK